MNYIKIKKKIIQEYVNRYYFIKFEEKTVSVNRMSKLEPRIRKKYTKINVNQGAAMVDMRYQLYIRGFK